MSLSKAPRVLIVRLSAIGDCLLTLPLACAIKDQLPAATVTWVVERAAAPLLRGHTCIDRLIELPRGWLKSPRTVWGLRRALREQNCEVAIDAQSLTKSSAAAWLSGARKRIGFARPWGRELSLLMNNVRIEPTNEHIVDRQLELLAPLGVKWPQVRFDVPRDAAAEQRVTAWLNDSRFENGFITVNPGAGWDSKLWPVERFAQVAAHVGRAHRLPTLVVWGGNRERAWAQEIVQAADGHAHVAPPTTLPELAAVVRRARLFVGSDTGPMHLASAVGTPCVALYGPSRPELCGPFGSQHAVLQAYYQAGTSRQRRRASNDAMRAIESAAVCEACDAVFARSEARQAA